MNRLTTALLLHGTATAARDGMRSLTWVDLSMSGGAQAVAKSMKRYTCPVCNAAKRETASLEAAAIRVHQTK